MTKRLIKFLGLAGLLFLYPSSLNADLNTYTCKIIKTAFMNGCVRTLNSDLDTIRYLKENQYDMKRYVEAQAGIYMREVSFMNKGKNSGSREDAPGQRDDDFRARSFAPYNH